MPLFLGPPPSARTGVPLELAEAQALARLVPAIEAYFDAHRALLPSLSHHSARVLTMGEELMRIDIGELVLLVRSDAASAAELMRAANASRFGANHKVAGLDEAIIRLGRREVYHLLAAVTTRSLFEPSLRQLLTLMPQHWYRLQHHAVTCAFGSAWLCTTLKLGAYEPAFIAGMFHDIGKLGALFCLGQLILAGQPEFEVSFGAAAQMLELVHTAMGVRMLEGWKLTGLPQSVCADQHGPVTQDHATGAHIHLVRVVSSLDVLHENAYVPTALDAELRDSLAALGLDARQLAQASARVQALREQVTLLLGPKPPPGSALCDAMGQAPALARKPDLQPLKPGMASR